MTQARFEQDHEAAIVFNIKGRLVQSLATDGLIHGCEK